MFKFFKEFKEFAVKGNMLDIAVGVIIGASFNGVVDILVKKIMTPPLSLLTDGINFANKKLVLREGIIDGIKVIREEVSIEYGALITALINFIIVALAVFFVVKLANRLKASAEDTKDAKAPTPANIQLLSDLKKLMEDQNELLRSAQNRK